MHMRKAPNSAVRCTSAPLVFPSTARAARQAARGWFQADTDLSAMEFRDLKFREHCQEKANDSGVERHARLQTFRRAFAEALGEILVEEGRLHAAP